MSHIAELAARYVAAYRANDDAAIAAVSLEIAPSDWTAVMQRVDAELPELAIKLDPERLAAAGARLGMDPALAAAVTEGLTADLATFLSSAALSTEAIAERFLVAVPSLDASHAGRVRFRLKQLANGMLDARRLTTDALEALAAATDQSVAYIRQLASVPKPLAAAGMAARADEQRAGDGQPARVVEQAAVVDELFGLGTPPS